MLGNPLVTDQTGPEGETVESVYVEAAEDTAAECFAAIALDLETGHPMLLASTEGGVAFEERAKMDSDTVKTLILSGGDAEKAIAEFLGTLGLDAGGAAPLAAALQAFTETDMALLEINPYAQTKAGKWIALDAKIVLDASAAFRHPEFEALAPKRKDEAPNINFVALDGDLGVIVNGAGLGLATNDMIIDAGGKPANFMDIRTTASSFDIARGVEMLLADKRVKALLLNVHGGGMTVCDTVAEGVAFAYSRSERKLPVIARLAGVNAEWGNRILTDRKIPVEIFDAMKPAVARAVARAGGA